MRFPCAPAAAPRRAASDPHHPPATRSHAEGSVLVEFGDTRVLCTATRRGQACRRSCKGKGAGLGDGRVRHAAARHRTPAASARRPRGKQGGRTQEIQRLIGRSLRAVVDLQALGERTLHDRLRRAAGRRRHAHRIDHRRLRRARTTRCARCAPQRCSPASPLRDLVAAVSVGIVQRRAGASISTTPRTRPAETDMNVVMNDGGGFVEVQGTAEGDAFRRARAASADAGARASRASAQLVAAAARRRSGDCDARATASRIRARLRRWPPATPASCARFARAARRRSAGRRCAAAVELRASAPAERDRH
ncbi:MAG: hypothetical protein MZV65_13245 [Chromatiales bacterium]|nr:hypothetical protein [Chromatiales bacterium]